MEQSCSNSEDDLATAGAASPGAIRTEGDEGVVGRAAAEDFWRESDENRKGLECQVKVVRRRKCKEKKKYHSLLSFQFEYVRHHAFKSSLRTPWSRSFCAVTKLQYCSTYSSMPGVDHCHKYLHSEDSL